MTRVLHSYTDVRPNDQLETLLAIDKIVALWPHLTVISSKVENPDGYWRFLLENWGEDTIVNVEQDIVPTPSMIESLLECPQVLCTYPYQLGENNWSLWYATFLKTKMEWTDKHGKMPPDIAKLQPTFTDSLSPPFPVFAQCSGFGLVKIHKSIQDKIPLSTYPVTEREWSYIDSWISYFIVANLNGLRWHVHSPIVKHNHSQ